MVIVKITVYYLSCECIYALLIEICNIDSHVKCVESRMYDHIDVRDVFPRLTNA